MEKKKFRWRYLLLSLPAMFFFSFVDQGGTFFPSEIHAAGILLLGLLMGMKKKGELFILNNVFSTMLFVFGMLNLYAMPGTKTATSLATNPLTLFPSFSLALLAYAVFSVISVKYRQKKENNSSIEEKKKDKLTYTLIPVSYFASLGLYVLSNFFIRALYPARNGTDAIEASIWENWQYQNDILMFTGLLFIALAFISIPMLKRFFFMKR